MAESRSFQDQQYAFAAHIRDPEHTIAPVGVEDRRMAIYRRLFFNNLYNLLGTFFPVLRKIHDDAAWTRFIREFMVRHRAKTPYFLELPAEFVEFLQQEYAVQPDDYAFLAELAHYEYAELALSVSDTENDLSDIAPDGDLLAGIPVKSDLACAFAYSYPVHKISPDFLPDTPGDQPTYLALYRNSQDKVRFLELNAVTAALLDAIENNDSGLPGEALLRELGKTINYPDLDALVQHGFEALQEMRRVEIICGTRPVQ